MKKQPEQQKAENAAFKAWLKTKNEKGQKEKRSYISTGQDIKNEDENYSLLLRNLGFDLASTTAIEEVLERVIEYVLKAEEIAATGIYFYNMETGDLEYSLSSGLSDRFVEHAKKLRGFQSFMYRRLLRKGVPVYTNFSKIPHGSKIFGQENLQEIGIIPVKYGNKVIGSLNIGSRSPLNLRTETKIFLETVSAQASGTLWRISSQYALLQSQKNFQRMFETANDLILVLDTNGNILRANPIAEKRLGYLGKELRGTSIVNLHPPEKHREATFAIDEILAGRSTFYAIPLFTKNGQEIHVETRIQHGEWDGKEVYYGISRDISDQIKTSEELRTSENIWQFALESLGEGFWDWNVKTNRIFISRECLRMFGYKEDDAYLTAEEWTTIIHPDDLKKVLLAQVDHLKGETEIFRNEYRVLCHDGCYKWILDRAKVIRRDVKGNPERMIGIITDISAQKRFENSLITALQKEKELNELKSQLVSMASHEFRTPLATMLMAVEILDAHWNEMLEDDIEINLKRIKSNIHFLRDIIERIFNLSRAESGELKFNPVQTDLNHFIQTTIMDFKKSPDVRHKIIYQGSDKPVKTEIDRQMVQEVIMNLLSNSIKFSGEKTIIHIILHEQGNNVTIQVSDRGIGIPEAEKDIVFEAFRRCSNVGNIRGIGIGLTLCQKYVHLHGGEITFISQVNKGTTFTVLLPNNR